MHWRALLAFGISAFLTGCASGIVAPAAQCKFVYDAHVRDGIVIPAVRKIEAKFYSNWSYAKPALYEHDGKVEILLDMFDKGYLDPPGFIVVLNPCTLDVLDAYETDAWFNDTRKKSK
jgi:hypothetical protein